MILQSQSRTIVWISDRQIAAPDRKPCSSGSEYSRPDRLTPRRRIGAPVLASTMILLDVVRLGSPFESSPFIKRAFCRRNEKATTPYRTGESLADSRLGR